MSTRYRTCWLMEGIAKQGAIQASNCFVNGIVDSLLQNLFTRSNYLCDQNWRSTVMRMLEKFEHWTHLLEDEFDLSLKIPDNFWDIANLTDEGFIQWGVPMEAHTSNFTVVDQRLLPLVDSVIKVLTNPVGHGIVMLLGTTVPPTMGRFFRACVLHNGECSTNPPTDIQWV